MEHSNHYAALDGLPSRDPTPHPPNPPPGFISALDYTAMGMAVNEVYHPTPSPGMLCHGRDVHPTWASVDNVTATLRVWDSRVLSPTRT